MVGNPRLRLACLFSWCLQTPIVDIVDEMCYQFGIRPPLYVPVYFCAGLVGVYVAESWLISSCSIRALFSADACLCTLTWSGCVRSVASFSAMLLVSLFCEMLTWLLLAPVLYVMC